MKKIISFTLSLFIALNTQSIAFTIGKTANTTNENSIAEISYLDTTSQAIKIEKPSTTPPAIDIKKQNTTPATINTKKPNGDTTPSTNKANSNIPIKKPIPVEKPKPIKQLEVMSQGAILMNLNTEALLGGKNIHQKFYPASTTKILTAIIAIESGKMNKIFTVGANPPLVEPSKIYLKKGEKISLRALVYGLMFESGNDAALAIAEGLSGSQKAFAKLMNEKAKKLGCKDSNFVNPNGLPNSNHYTSAYDLAFITKHAMKNSEFRKVIGSKYYTISKTNKSPKRTLKNHNKMLFKDSGFYYSGCIGGKTGWTGDAKYTHVSIVTRNNTTLIAVVLKDKSYAYYDLIKMFDYGFQ